MTISYMLSSCNPFHVGVLTTGVIGRALAISFCDPPRMHCQSLEHLLAVTASVPQKTNVTHQE
eukprot:2112552-Amphidinium_carterae.1